MSDETKWSPEPWRRGEEHESKIEVLSSDGRAVCTVHGSRYRVGGERMEVDYRRIVACVNACAGIPTEALEAGAIAETVKAAARYLNAEATWANLYGWSGEKPAKVEAAKRDKVAAREALVAALRSLGWLE